MKFPDMSRFIKHPWLFQICLRSPGVIGAVNISDLHLIDMMHFLNTTAFLRRNGILRRVKHISSYFIDKQLYIKKSFLPPQNESGSKKHEMLIWLKWCWSCITTGRQYIVMLGREGREQKQMICWIIARIWWTLNIQAGWIELRRARW